MEITANKIYHSETYEDSIAFLEQCDKQGITWGAGGKATKDSRWYDHECQTCYRVYKKGDSLRIILSSMDFYVGNDYFESYEIITYSSMTIEDIVAIDTAWKELMQIK